MVHTYQITGMSCKNCEDEITSSLKSINGIIDVEVSKDDEKATITMKHHIEIVDLKTALPEKYQILSIESSETNKVKNTTTNNFNWRDVIIWRKAGFNTFNCLIGCSIGDFLMIIFLQHKYPETPMMTQMILATIAGLISSVALETTILNYRENFSWKVAFKTAIGMSFLSMVAMELAMNSTDFMITGGKMTMGNPKYWLAFIPSAIVGFLVPLPYNYYQLKRHNKACH